MNRYGAEDTPRIGEKFINRNDGKVYVLVTTSPSVVESVGCCGGCAFVSHGCITAPECLGGAHFEATGEIGPEETMSVHVCDKCGGANVLRDAFVHVNDKDDVRTFDALFCEDCDGETNIVEVTVPITFDIYSDKFDLATLKKEES